MRARPLRADGAVGCRGAETSRRGALKGLLNPSQRRLFRGVERSMRAIGEGPVSTGARWADFEAIAEGDRPWVRPQRDTQRTREAVLEALRTGHRGAGGGRAGAHRASSHVSFASSTCWGWPGRQENLSLRVASPADLIERARPGSGVRRLQSPQPRAGHRDQRCGGIPFLISRRGGRADRNRTNQHHISDEFVGRRECSPR